MTEREYLISLGLAKPGRGRFSKAGKEALAAARAEGKTFTVPVVKSAAPALSAAVRSAKAKPVEKVKPQGEADPKVVRQWANDNGVEVAARGRIKPEVTNAYLNACKVKGVAVAAPVVPASQDFRAAAVPIHPRVMFKVTDLDESTREVSYRTVCNECGYSMYHCPAPKVFSDVDPDVLVSAVPTNRPVANDGRFW